ncbi:hypothetical protein FRC03_007976 [Tulasnella sp. 419]|nr:hypothetical protein FRC03_007976 [Tulasnella sp. 419]
MDDFTDLVWTNTSSKQQDTTKKTGNQYDAFSMLAQGGSKANYLSSSSSTPSSRPLTPSQRPASSTSNVQQPTVNASSGDAFSNLLSFGTSASNSKSLSMAERQAQAERERREKAEAARKQMQVNGSFWDKFESSPSMTPSTSNGMTSPASSVPKPTPAKASSLASPSLLAPTVLRPSSSASSTSKPAQPSTTSTKSAAVTVWDFDLLAAPSTTGKSQSPKPTTSTPPKPSTSDDLFGDFDAFTSAPPSSQPAKGRSRTPPRSQSPGDFDFGDRDDVSGLLDGGDASDDDILGALSKPVGEARREASRSPQPRSTESREEDLRHSPPLPQRKPRSSSPPPHILGQIIEMGFSIQQARVALAATDTGVDVQAALDILLNQGGGDEREPQGRPPNERSRNRERERDRDIDEDEERARQEAERRRRRRQGPTRSEIRDEEPKDENDSVVQIADQADKILAQASEIGLNMFSKANAFWKSTKETAAKAYEERMKAANSGGPSTNGRPRWMMDAEEEGNRPQPPRERDSERRPQRQTGGFRDDTEDREEPVLPPRPKQQTSAPRRAQEPPAQTIKQRTANLFDSEGGGYVSPARRKKPTTSSAAPSTSVPVAAPTPPPRPKKPRVTCPPSTLAASTTHRTKATESYKLGQYAVSETSFTSAIDLLPEKHLALVPLWNNRAMTRLKIGDHSGAVSDCTSVLELVGTDYRFGDEGPNATNDADGAGVSHGEALVKAVSRRAAAYEMAEKWDKAKDDWELLLGNGANWGPAGVKSRAEAVRGLERCRKMTGVVASGGDAQPVEQSRPKPAPKPVVRKQTSASTAPSVAVTRLKEANASVEAEEVERANLKDTVDARLIAWKGGKETNIRALIASLDNVLWAELGWVKVGMAELVTPQQVKIRYMKAIAKLHPDKTAREASPIFC